MKAIVARDLPGKTEAYEAASDEATAALTAYLDAADAARVARSEYEDLWRQAKSVGVDVPVKTPAFTALTDDVARKLRERSIIASRFDW